MRRQKHDAPRRKSQVFRSNELLKALESAEALTTGVGTSDTAASNGSSSHHPPLEPTVVPLAPPTSRSGKDKATAPEAKPANEQGHLSLASVSKLKVIAIQTHRRLNKQKQLRNMLVLKTTQEEDESDLLRSDAESIAKASGSHGKAPSLGTSTKGNHNARTNVIGRYETPEIKWKAKIQGEIEKFMYPSLRLESLYAVDSPPTEHRRRSQVEKEVAIPSIASVEELMAASTQVEWEKEKKYKNSRQSVPPNDHERVSEEDARRLRFDTKLEVAEGLLRMKDMASMAPMDLPAETEPTKQHFSVPEDDEIVMERRRRAASLYHPNVVPSQMRIPRLPQTRKYVFCRLSMTGVSLVSLSIAALGSSRRSSATRPTRARSSTTPTSKTCSASGKSYRSRSCTSSACPTTPSHSRPCRLARCSTANATNSRSWPSRSSLGSTMW